MEDQDNQVVRIVVVQNDGDTDDAFDNPPLNTILVAPDYTPDD